MTGTGIAPGCAARTKKVRAVNGKKTPEERQAILMRLDDVERAINRIRTPLSFADQLFVLRSHVNMVSERLTHGMAAA
ncbi:MAG TPA: hypothetical protein VF523_03850 [Burkholderiales bacterium]